MTTTLETHAIMTVVAVSFSLLLDAVRLCRMAWLNRWDGRVYGPPDEYVDESLEVHQTEASAFWAELTVQTGSEIDSVLFGILLAGITVNIIFVVLSFIL